MRTGEAIRVAVPLLLAAGGGACSSARHGGGRGLAPDAAPSLSLAVKADGRFAGAALGWSLGGEVHLYVADTTFSREVFARLIGPHLLHEAVPLDSAMDGAKRRVLSLDADSLPRAMQDSVDATILSESGAVPAQLSLVRLHAGRGGTCTSEGPVTELVYRVRGEDLGAGPRAHATVVGLLRPIGTAPMAVPLPPSAGGARARTLLVVTALAASRVTTHLDAPAEALLALPTVDPEREDDAGEVLAIPRTPEGGSGSRVAVAVRARFGIGADTSLISGVALTDGSQTVLKWVLTPVRARLSAGAAPVDSRSRGLRYVLRGRVAYPPDRALLLVDQIDDVRARESRILVVDPTSGHLLATQPLALNCRDR